VRRPQVGKLGEQIAVRTYPIPRDFPIRDYSQEGIGDVIGGFAAIARVARRARGVIAQEIRQECPCHAPCFLRRIPARMLQRVSEDWDETEIGRRLPGAIDLVLLADKESEL